MAERKFTLKWDRPWWRHPPWRWRRERRRRRLLQGWIDSQQDALWREYERRLHDHFMYGSVDQFSDPANTDERLGRMLAERPHWGGYRPSLPVAHPRDAEELRRNDG